MAWRRIFWTALMSFGAVARAEADSIALENAYRQAAERVEKHSDNIWLDGNPKGERALNHAWALLAEWTAAYLEEHPGATPKLLKRAAPGGDLEAVPLGPRTMLVSAAAGPAFGTIFIVDGTHGPFHPVWSIRGRTGRDAFPLLDAWTAKAAGENCREAVGDPDWLRCGPVGGTAKRLADDAQGHPRFFVEASYAEVAGNTEAEQLSFWTWTGATAEPQFVTTAGVNIDDESTRLDGELLKVRVAENYRMISPWWDHYDRELDWEFRAGPQRIEDLGKMPVVPEMDTVDEVLFRAAHHLPADDLATREVQATIGKIVPDAGAGGEASLGMYGSSTVRHEDGRTLVCLPAQDPGILTFTLTGAFVSGLSVTPDESGKGCPSDKP
jgi:hypothetical protein